MIAGSTRFRRRFPLEVGLILSAVAVVVGVALLVGAAAGWDFKPLDPTRSMRTILPAVTILVLGLQTALCSLLLSILGLPSARPSVRACARAAPQRRRMNALDRWIQDWRIRQAVRFLPPDPRVLDVGCDDGALFRALGPALREGVGLDPALERAAEGDRYRLLPGAFPADAPDEPGSFDAVTMLAVMEHVPPDDQPKVVERAFDLLRPGGRFILTVPSPAVDTILDVLIRLRLLARHGGRSALRLRAGRPRARRRRGRLPPARALDLPGPAEQPVRVRAPPLTPAAAGSAGRSRHRRAPPE